MKTLSWNRAFSNSVFEGDWREISWEDLKLSEKLGSGAFGVVYKGQVILEGGREVQCAVKTVKGIRMKPFSFLLFAYGFFKSQNRSQKVIRKTKLKTAIISKIYGKVTWMTGIFSQVMKIQLEL